MGYDVELIPLNLPKDTRFPVEPKTARKLLDQAGPFADMAAVRSATLKIPGCKPGPDNSVDFLGSGLSYARLTIKPAAIHVENNCGAKDLLRIHEALRESIGPMYILDLQSKQLHSPESFKEWWSRPL